MRNIVLLSNRPCRHMKYLNQLVDMTGCKIEAFLISKMYYYEQEAVYIESDEELKKVFPYTQIKNVEKISEIEEFYYNRDNTIILADMEPGNALSYDFCKKNVSETIYYSIESRDTICEWYRKHGEERVLIPTYYIDGALLYSDDRMSKLIEIIK